MILLVSAVALFAFAPLMVYSDIRDDRRRERAAVIAHTQFLLRYSGGSKS